MIEALKEIFKNKKDSIIFAYVFGSRAANEHSELSDLDIAVYLEKTSKNSEFDIKIDLYTQINRTLKINDIDIVIMNRCKNIVLLHQVTTQGRVLCDHNPDFRNRYEQKVLHSALDFLSHRNAVMGI